MTQRDFLKTYGGKLAAITAPLMAALAYVATDPTAAILLAEFLPAPIRLVVILGIAFVAYVLPLFTAKKDAQNGERES